MVKQHPIWSPLYLTAVIVTIHSFPALGAGSSPSLYDECLSHRKSACQELIRIATDDKGDPEDRRTALRTISVLINEGFLAGTAYARSLADIALHDPDAHVRSAAVRCLWWHAGPRPVEGLWNVKGRTRGDVTLLAKIATEDTDSGVRLVAVDGVGAFNQQSTLAKAAVGDNDWAVRSQAVKYLSDEALVQQIGVNDKDNRVRRAALTNIFVKTHRAYLGPQLPPDRVSILQVGRGLHVLVDGLAWFNSGKSPVTLFLTPGQHKLEFSLLYTTGLQSKDRSEETLLTMGGSTYAATLVTQYTGETKSTVPWQRGTVEHGTWRVEIH
jgi:hypothetical protein